MRATAAALLLLVLAVVARGGEAREGDGVSARQLLTDKKCTDSNCHDVLKPHCKWLPEGEPKCDYKGKTYHVKVKNCFAFEVGSVTIKNGHECKEYPTHSNYLGTLELKCGDTITIYGYDKHKLKGDGSESPCKHTIKKCKTCKYKATYHCDAKYHPGDKCRKAEDVCDKPAYFDEHCYCPPNGFKPKTKECRAADGKCDAAEYCTGDSAHCPDDKVQDEHTVCRPKDEHKPCDVKDTCDGKSKKCKDKVADEGTVCRKSTGPCDAAEKCDGHSKKCPKDCCVYHPKQPYCPAKYI